MIEKRNPAWQPNTVVVPRTKNSPICRSYYHCSSKSLLNSTKRRLFVWPSVIYVCMNSYLKVTHHGRTKRMVRRSEQFVQTCIQSTTFLLVPSRKQAFKLFNADEASQLLQVGNRRRALLSDCWLRHSSHSMDSFLPWVLMAESCTYPNLSRVVSVSRWLKWPAISSSTTYTTTTRKSLPMHWASSYYLHQVRRPVYPWI